MKLKYLFSLFFILLVGTISVSASPLLPNEICFEIYGGGEFCFLNHTINHSLKIVGDLNVTGTSYLGDIIISAENISVDNINSVSGEGITFYDNLITTKNITIDSDDNGLILGDAIIRWSDANSKINISKSIDLGMYDIYARIGNFRNIYVDEVAFADYFFLDTAVYAGSLALKSAEIYDTTRFINFTNTGIEVSNITTDNYCNSTSCYTINDFIDGEGAKYQFENNNFIGTGDFNTTNALSSKEVYTGYIKNTSSIFIQPNSDVDDYFNFSTVSNVPTLTTTGSSDLIIEASGDNILMRNPGSPTYGYYDEIHSSVLMNSLDLYGPFEAYAMSTTSWNYAYMEGFFAGYHDDNTYYKGAGMTGFVDIYGAGGWNVFSSTQARNFTNIWEVYGTSETSSQLTTTNLVGRKFHGNYYGSGTFENVMGVLIADSGGTITNDYGLKIESISGGTNNWAIYQEGSTSPSYFEGNLSALDLYDRSPAWEKSNQEALQSILNIKNKENKKGKIEIDHSTLPDIAKGTFKKVEKTNCRMEDKEIRGGKIVQIEVCDENVIEEEGRSLGGMISVQVEAIKGLNQIITSQNQTIELLKSELCSKDNTYSWCGGKEVK